ncbi:cytochrome b/b6 domain-containing protein [Flavobacterium antarcticum]|uniref:cytochrome b/b6 domain-containing protein n=1 Tax=Flavobacterium antarcticum TaxID=271155 RepID=UPI0003B30C18|nr:cytochrome b/b6 domain-containing protein [Flavobacterium antarcticum]
MEGTQKFTVIHRILHWTIAFVMPVLFITGFLRMFWLNKNGMAAVIDSKTAASPLPKEVVTDIAKTIRAPMWEWHELFANIMVVAFIARIIYMIAKGIRFPNPFRKNNSLKEKLQGFVYIYFYVFVFISAFTGICIQKEFFTDYADLFETIHKWGLYWFPIYIVLHLAGIAIAENSNKKGIASKMIGGE